MEEKIALIRKELGLTIPRMTMSERELKIAKESYEEKARRLQRKIENINAVSPPPRLVYNGDTLVPILPFRLWLLSYMRRSEETIKAFADRVQQDEAIIRRWMEGIVWEGDCKPRPVHSVSIGIVDKVLTLSGVGPHMLDELYPYIEEK